MLPFQPSFFSLKKSAEQGFIAGNIPKPWTPEVPRRLGDAIEGVVIMTAVVVGRRFISMINLALIQHMDHPIDHTDIIFVADSDHQGLPLSGSRGNQCCGRGRLWIRISWHCLRLRKAPATLMGY